VEIEYGVAVEAELMSGDVRHRKKLVASLWFRIIPALQDAARCRPASFANSNEALCVEEWSRCCLSRLAGRSFHGNDRSTACVEDLFGVGRPQAVYRTICGGNGPPGDAGPAWCK